MLVMIVTGCECVSEHCVSFEDPATCPRCIPVSLPVAAGKEPSSHHKPD